MAACLLGAALLAPLQVQAAPGRRALLVGPSADSVLRRVADELRAAGYDVGLETQALVDQAEFVKLAERRHVSAIVELRPGNSGPEVLIFVTDPKRGETTLRQLKFRVGAEAESMLALRIVEVLNGSLLELDPTRAKAPKPAQASNQVETKPALRGEAGTPPFSLSLCAGARGLWLSGGLASFVGPEVAVRTAHRSGFFIDASGFVSASSERVHAASGKAELRAFASDIEVGLARPLGHRLSLGTGLAFGLLGAWANAEPALGYRARSAQSLSALILLRGEANYAITQAVSAYAVFGMGGTVPSISMSLASQPVGNAGPWVASGSAGLSLEWGG